MKTRTFSAIFTFATLTVIAGSALAGAHDGYNQAFYGKSSDNATEMAGKAAYGTPSGNPWSGHEAYQRAFGGDGAAFPSPVALVETKGRAAYGTTSGPDGNEIYDRAVGSN